MSGDVEMQGGHQSCREDGGGQENEERAEFVEGEGRSCQIAEKDEVR